MLLVYTTGYWDFGCVSTWVYHSCRSWATVSDNFAFPAWTIANLSGNTEREFIPRCLKLLLLFLMSKRFPEITGAVPLIIQNTMYQVHDHWFRIIKNESTCFHRSELKQSLEEDMETCSLACRDAEAKGLQQTVSKQSLFDCRGRWEIPKQFT